MSTEQQVAAAGGGTEDGAEEANVLAERQIADAGQSQAYLNYSQKVIEQKEKELMESIAKNYGRIREVEKELANLQLQLKLTAGPKKHALEMLRKKIEVQNERVASVRARHAAAKQTYERLDAELRHEEGLKDQLCGELSTLVQQAARAQMDKLEELKNHLEGLYSGVMPKETAAAAAAAAAAVAAAQPQPEAHGGQPAVQQDAQQATASNSAPGPSPPAPPAAPSEQELQQQREEQERRRREAEAAERRRIAEAQAAAARSRHVTLSTSSNGGSNPFGQPGAGPQGPGTAGGGGGGGDNPFGPPPGQGTGVRGAAGGRGPGAVRAGAAGAANGGVVSAGGSRGGRGGGGGGGGSGGQFAGFDT